MTTYAELTEQLHTIAFLPVVRTADAETAINACTELLAAGLTVLEITATIPGWENVIRTLKAAHPEATIGAGTIRTRQLAAASIAAGSDFIVSPGIFADVIDEAENADVPFIPGVLTPTELFNARHHGLVKLFPASLGGVRYLTGLTALTPDAHILPTGGITVPAIGEWKAAGAWGVGIGVKSVDDVRAFTAQLTVAA